MLHRAGFDAKYASTVARNGLWTALTLAMSEPGRTAALASMSEAERVEHQRLAMIRLASLPPGQYPRLVEAAVPMTACDDPDFHYRPGIDLFIDGVRAMASRPDAAAGN